MLRAFSPLPRFLSIAPPCLSWGVAMAATAAPLAYPIRLCSNDFLFLGYTHPGAAHRQYAAHYAKVGRPSSEGGNM